MKKRIVSITTSFIIALAICIGPSTNFISDANAATKVENKGHIPY